MTKIRSLLVILRIRRDRQLSKSDSLSFEAFCNNSSAESYPSCTKESSLIDNYVPTNKMSEIEYENISPPRVPSIWQTKLKILLFLLLLLSMFFIPNIFMYISAFYKAPEDCATIQKESSANVEMCKKLDILPSSSSKYAVIPITTKELPPPPKPDYDQCKATKDANRFDCYPEDGASAQKCEARGCCWVPKKSKLKRKKIDVPLNVPYCFYPPNYQSYKYVNMTYTAYGLEAYLKRSYRSPYPNDVETIKMVVKYETENRLHVKFVDPSHYRFEPPYPQVPVVDRAAGNLSYNLIIDPLRTGFRVFRKSDSSLIFDSNDLPNMVYSDQFLQYSIKLQSSKIYGLGEHRSSLMLSTNWQRFTMFAHDAVPTENKNLYGSHPFYMVLEPTGNSHGVFLLNSNAMDVILQPTPAITFRPIGGILDFYIFMGPSPGDVISQYTALIGRPYMPPYWGLGFHLCRFGYKTLNETKKVMERNIAAGIPIDTQWNDLDYMNNSNDFTYDHKNFKELPQFVEELHQSGMHYIPLIDPGVSASEVPGTYEPFDKGVQMDIFVKNSTGNLFIGKVWNRASTVWPDFTNPKTLDYWISMLKKLHREVQFDGAWIDMNEPSNFLSGSFDGCPNSTLEDPPYVPAVDGGQLRHKTLCMSAQHYGGLHYNVHNLYGFVEAIVTNFALADIRGKRPMVISRSTFPGHGHYAGHWSGDVNSRWYDMKYSIPQMLSFSMFGIPLMGADICGFNENTTATLCNRWMQLGAFYPFSRNHNTDDGIPQDPAALGPDVILSSKKALTIRYTLLPYLYTLFWSAHVHGETVARPLFFEFPKDNNTHAIDDQFLWGSSLMIIPVLEEATLKVTPYVPTGVWYDYYTRESFESKGKRMNISAPLDTIPLLIRGGSIIPQQGFNMTTTAARKNKVELLVAPDRAGDAFGKLYWDDGDTLNAYEELKYSLIQFTLHLKTLNIQPVFYSTEHPPNLGKVTILGVDYPTSKVFVNNVSQTFKYDAIHKYLLLNNLDLSVKKSITISWQ